MNIKYIIKRNGFFVNFNPEKIYNAIKKAYVTVYPITDKDDQLIREITKKVVYDLNDLHLENIPISVIQNFVEQRLMDAGLLKVAEHYIDYRIQRDIDRYGYGNTVNVVFHLEKVR